ncbi:MAG: hypothetical protein IT320_04785 [Anaerolineae bacterium]|nr:hypothetical protein [Anaerolineae bacterium]
MRGRPLALLALVGFGLLLALGALELGLRAWFETRGSEIDRIRYVYDRATIDAKTMQLAGVPYLNFVPNPALDDVNERGYRGALAAIPKPDGVYRIVALGGSTTYGHGLTEDESWPRQLEHLLREEHGLAQAEVVNLGAPGYFSLDSAVNLATRGLAHEPDLVIVYHGINDAIVRMFQAPDCYVSASPLIGMGLDRGIWQYSGDDLPSSTLYRLVGLRLGWMTDPAVYRDRLHTTGFCPPEPGTNPLDLLDANPPVYFERNLRSITAMGQSAGAKVALSTFAWDTATAQAALDADPSLLQAAAMLRAIAEQNALIPQIADDTGALALDLAAELGQGDYFQGDQVHQTAAGAHRQAEIYAAAIAPLIGAGS